jgi:hypothetical protein
MCAISLNVHIEVVVITDMLQILTHSSHFQFAVTKLLLA